MNKLLNISICFILTLNFGYSQSIKRSVISSFGSSSSNSTTYLSETFGQPSSIGTVSDGNSYIRQGFEQPPNITTFGCTDPLACNYDSTANQDDGSCAYPNTGASSVSACNTYTWEGQTITSSGNLTHSYQNISGCDSVHTLSVIINNSISTTTNPIICSGSSITVGNSTYNITGTYIDSLVTVLGCDSVITTNLTVSNIINFSTSQTVCNSYTWNATTYTASGTYSDTTVNSSGCDSISTLNLTINPSTTSSNTVTQCDSYTWNSQTYTTSGSYTFVTPNSNGCDSTATLNLTINPSTSTFTSITTCSNYSWNGITYTSSGIYTETSTNSNGCLHTDSLDLTINLSTSTSTPITECDSYIWNGITYISSGIYTDTSTNSNGCLHTDSLILTIEYSTSTSTTDIECDSYTWSVNGTTYTSSGLYIETSTNSNGCLHSDTLVLTINTTTNSATIITQCDSYTWNGSDFTTSGLYTYNTINANGCDSTATLDLTILILGVTDVVTNVSCFGAADGSIDLSVIGGIEPYIYQWSSGEITEDIEDLTANNYSVTVSDSYGCESIHNMIIDEPLELESNPITTNASCEEKPDGRIDISAYGGTSPYTYLWSNGQITEDIENLFTGDYFVTITDFNNCVEIDSIYIDFDGFENCFFIPTLFTPNGDGVHDDWQIDGLSVFPDITVKIFNRWGQLLFESVGYTQRWDGTYKGKELPIAAYYYIIDLGDGSEPYKGTITIKR